MTDLRLLLTFAVLERNFDMTFRNLRMIPSRAMDRQYKYIRKSLPRGFNQVSTRSRNVPDNWVDF